VSADLKLIDDALLHGLSERAAGTARRRVNHNLHPALGDPVQRLCNAFEPGTYVRPHRHTQAGRWELFLALIGRAAVLVFDGDGRVQRRVVLDAGGPVRGVELSAGTWHTVVSLDPGTVLFEVKPGPYEALTDKDFAPWAPAEGEAAAARFETWYRSAAPGECPPSDQLNSKA
jgi:cupin fold WbuC family metalloprotein